MEPVESRKPEQRKRKSPQGAKCSVPECGKSIKRGQGVCRACYLILDSRNKTLEFGVGEEEKERIKVEAENEKLVKENEELTTEKALRDNVLSPSFRFTVYQEVPKSPGVEWHPNPLEEIERILPAPKSRTVIEISDAGVVRCKMYQEEAEKLANLVVALRYGEDLPMIDPKERQP